jgi:hypothetical protein
MQESVSCAGAGIGDFHRTRHQRGRRAMRHKEADDLAGLFIEFLETGTVPEGLFTPDVFCDFTMPTWRLQAEGIDGVLALRKAGHPGPGNVPRWRTDPTMDGFVLEFEERWEQDGTEWYSREMTRADVRDGRIAAFSVYCTGDWDPEHLAKHAASVHLLRP